MMTIVEENAFRAVFNVRTVERCCGTCRHFDRDYELAGCGNPRQVEFDSAEQKMRTIPDYTPDTYGAYGGVEVNEGMVCDLWEAMLNKEGK